MTYSKPQLIGYAATEAVQSHTKGPNNPEPPNNLSTPAYEADE